MSLHFHQMTNPIQSRMILLRRSRYPFFFFKAEDGMRDGHVTGVQTCALPICPARREAPGTTGPPRETGRRLPPGPTPLWQDRRRVRSGRADVLWPALTEADGHGALLDAADDAERQAPAAHPVQRRVELVGVGHRLAVDRHDQVAGLDARVARRAALLDDPDQQALALGQADRAAQLPGHASRRDADAKARPCR